MVYTLQSVVITKSGLVSFARVTVQNCEKIQLGLRTLLLSINHRIRSKIQVGEAHSHDHNLRSVSSSVPGGGLKVENQATTLVR